MAAFNKFNSRSKITKRNENVIMSDTTDDSSESDSDDDSQNRGHLTSREKSSEFRPRFTVIGCREVYLSSSTEDDSDSSTNSSISTDCDEQRDKSQVCDDEEDSDLDDKIINDKFQVCDDEENSELDDKIMNVVSSSPVSDEENNLYICSVVQEDPPPAPINSSFLQSNINLRSESDNPSKDPSSLADSIGLFFRYLELETRKLSDQKRKVLVNDFQNKLFEMQKD